MEQMEKTKEKPARSLMPFTTNEDQRLMELYDIYKDDWEKIAAIMKKTTRQVRDRYKYKLDPNINRKPFTIEEIDLLERSVKDYGHRWVFISGLFKNRTPYQLRNKYDSIKHIPRKRNYVKKAKLQIGNADENENENPDGSPTESPMDEIPEKQNINGPIVFTAPCFVKMSVGLDLEYQIRESENEWKAQYYNVLDPINDFQYQIAMDGNIMDIRDDEIVFDVDEVFKKLE